MSSRYDRIDPRKLVLAIGLAALMLAVAQPVRAEVRISGQADALILETRAASVDEVLAALRASFNLQYRTSGALTRVITGTYAGSLQRVLARLLEGHNYVLQSSAGGGELIVFGPGMAGGSVSASPRPFVAGGVQPELLASTGSSGVEGWTDTAPIGPPRTPATPAANNAPQAASSGSPLSASVPAMLPPHSIAVPAKSIVVPAPAPPQPDPDLQNPQRGGVEGWNG